jgi:hypothetical protein
MAVLAVGQAEHLADALQLVAAHDVRVGTLRLPFARAAGGKRAVPSVISSRERVA